MTRIASFAQSQSLLKGIIDNQTRVFEAQRQITNGKKADEFRGIASQASTLVGAKSLKSRTDAYVGAGQEIDRAIQTMDVQMGVILQSARDLRQTILEAIGQNEAAGFSGIVEGAYNLIANALNSRVGSAYMFAGSQVDIPPVNATSLSDLVALPLAADAFDNDQIKATARITDNFEMTYGIVADDLAGDLLASLKRIGEFIAGPSGPIDGPLTAAQAAFLDSELPQLDAAIQATQNHQVLNGLNAKKLEEITDLQQGQAVFLETFISDIEDVDIAEAITRLNNDRTALEASYRVVSTVSQLSLVQFI